MDHPREVHFLPTKAFHRSGTATRRCVKLVLFFTIENAVDCDNVCEECSSNLGEPEVVKTEKTVEEGEDQED